MLWILGEDEKRHRLRQVFPITFYAAGPEARLRDLWRWVCSQPVPVELKREQRGDLFQMQPVTVLVAQVQRLQDQPALFRLAQRAFPDLTFYDADIALTVRHAAQFCSFPLARV